MRDVIAHNIAMARQSLRASRLVTIAGIGGSRKTRLAIAIGEEELAHRPGGAWFVDLTSITNGEGIAGTVSAAMGLRLRSHCVGCTIQLFARQHVGQTGQTLRQLLESHHARSPFN